MPGCRDTINRRPVPCGPSKRCRALCRIASLALIAGGCKAWPRSGIFPRRRLRKPRAGSGSPSRRRARPRPERRIPCGEKRRSCALCHLAPSPPRSRARRRHRPESHRDRVAASSGAMSQGAPPIRAWSAKTDDPMSTPSSARSSGSCRRPARSARAAARPVISAAVGRERNVSHSVTCARNGSGKSTTPAARWSSVAVCCVLREIDDYGDRIPPSRTLWDAAILSNKGAARSSVIPVGGARTLCRDRGGSRRLCAPASLARS